MFQERLKELRKSRNLTQQDIADGADINVRLYQKYETGKNIPVIDTIIRIANFYDVSIDYLIGRTDVKEMNK